MGLKISWTRALSILKHITLMAFPKQLLVIMLSVLARYLKIMVQLLINGLLMGSAKKLPMILIRQQEQLFLVIWIVQKMADRVIIPWLTDFLIRLFGGQSQQLPIKFLHYL